MIKETQGVVAHSLLSNCVEKEYEGACYE